MSRRSDQPSPAARRALVAFQIFLVLATLLAPIPVAAEDPSADPSTSAPAATEPAKSFRNEISPGNFVFRMREFEQMEGLLPPHGNASVRTAPGR